jgi:LmbE family N-acetylglucosaminyl deacetylase
MTTLSAQTGRRLLSVFAHPDDETFGIGGTLALYSRRGVETHVVCATRGEVGEAPSGLRGFATIADMRSGELDCAARVLGLTSVRYLGYRDSGMPGSEHNAHERATVAAPLAEVARRIAWHIRDVRAQVIITFDPIGGYRHPDHIAIQRATLKAFRLAGDPGESIEGLPPYAPQKLYYTTFSRRALRFAVWLLKVMRRDPGRFGQNKDVDLTSLAEEEFPIHADISIRSVAAVKLKAAECHASQGGRAMARLPLRVLFRIFGAHEQFMRAIPSQAPPRIETDLFDGVTSIED